MGDTLSTTGKASFDVVYDQEDPRQYVRQLTELEYQIPAHASGVFRHLVEVLRQRRGNAPFSVLDLCCSYGPNAALLTHDLTLDELNAHYLSPAVQDLTSEELIAADREFLAPRRLPESVSVIGLDVAANALAYAQRAGILSAARAEDLEASDPSDELKQLLADTGLITVTGGIGYVTERTLIRLLDATGPPPAWIAAFVLRWIDMGPITHALEARGMRVERLPGRTFRQRKFAGDDERQYVMEQLAALGIDAEGVETDDYHHTWFYLVRPEADAEAEPLPSVVAGAVGMPGTTAS